MSNMEKLEHVERYDKDVDCTGMLEAVPNTASMYTDRVDDLEHNLTVANTKMDAIIEGTDASLKQLTQMYADAVEQQGEFNKEMNRRNQNTNKRLSKELKTCNRDIEMMHYRIDANLNDIYGLKASIGEIDTHYGQFNILVSSRLDNMYAALAVIFGLLTLMLVLVGYLLFSGA